MKDLKKKLFNLSDDLKNSRATEPKKSTKYEKMCTPRRKDAVRKILSPVFFERSLGRVVKRKHLENANFRKL